MLSKKLTEAACLYEDWAKTTNVDPDNNKSLINFLNYYRTDFGWCAFSYTKFINEFNYGFHYIVTYTELCEFAKILVNKGYSKISLPPCSATKYNEEVQKAKKIVIEKQINRKIPKPYQFLTDKQLTSGNSKDQEENDLLESQLKF